MYRALFKTSRQLQAGSCSSEVIVEDEIEIRYQPHQIEIQSPALDGTQTLLP